MLARVNSPRVQALLNRGEECEDKALSAQDADVRQTYRRLAQQWRHLARQVAELERERGEASSA